MSRKSIKASIHMISILKTKKKKGILYVGSFSFPELFEIFNSKDNPSAPSILLNFVITGVCLQMMSQIRISVKEEKVEYVDKLPSYRDIKRKIIAGFPGRLVAAVSGIASAMPYLMQDQSITSQEQDIILILSQIIDDMASSSSPNSRRIKPSINNWQEFAKGEMGSSLGQLISCPATNLKLLNIDGTKVKNYGLKDAVSNIGFPPEMLQSYNITEEVIEDAIRNNFTTDNSGMPISKLEYNEPKEIYSNIQTEILSDILIRNGNINANLEKGPEPDSPISKTQVEKYLSKHEFIAYTFAIKNGDKNILKKYTDIIKQRSMEI